jgi:hypothetical protein
VQGVDEDLNEEQQLLLPITFTPTTRTAVRG